MWKEKYFNMLFPIDVEEFNYAHSLFLKYENIPPLYRYREVNDRTIDSLKNDKVWLSSALEFNDPYDSGLTFNQEEIHFQKIKGDLLKEFCKKFNLDIEDVVSVTAGLSLDDTVTVLCRTIEANDQEAKNIRRVIQKVQEETKDIYVKYVSDMNEIYQQRIFAACFSERPDSILMWSHYAKYHTGICIEYDFKELEHAHEIIQNLYPVKYTNELIDLEKYKGSRKHVNTLTLAATSKSNDWEYEKEWRLIYCKNNDSKPFYQKLMKPKHVILGTKIKEDDKKKIIDVCKDRGISVKKAVLDRTKYQIHIVEYK